MQTFFTTGYTLGYSQLKPYLSLLKLFGKSRLNTSENINFNLLCLLFLYNLGFGEELILWRKSFEETVQN